MDAAKPRLAAAWRLPLRFEEVNYGRQCHLDIEKLRAWGLNRGVELIDADYRGANATYRWRCQKAGHVTARNKSNITQSIRKGHSGCKLCGPLHRAISLARKKRADEFAAEILPRIQDLQREGFLSLTAIAVQLNIRKIPSRNAAKWYASTVRNLLRRQLGHHHHGPGTYGAHCGVYHAPDLRSTMAK